MDIKVLVSLHKSSADLRNKTVTIEIEDDKSGVIFLELTMDDSDFLNAITGHSSAKAKASAKNLDLVGKTMTVEKYSFQLPENATYDNRKKLAIENAKKSLSPHNDGWVPDLDFDQQNSFTEKNGRLWANTLIRKWI